MINKTFLDELKVHNETVEVDAPVMKAVLLGLIETLEEAVEVIKELESAIVSVNSEEDINGKLGAYSYFHGSWMNASDFIERWGEMKYRLKIDTPWGDKGQIYTTNRSLKERERRTVWLPAKHYPPENFPELFEVITYEEKQTD